MKTNEMYVGKTMAELLEELKKSVDAYNLSDDTKKRIDLAVEQKAIIEEYNKTSLYTAYGECLAAENPILALAQMYYYDTISVRDAVHTEVVDGVAKSTMTRGTKEGCKKLNLVKFIEWTEESNTSVVADKNWRTATDNARKVVANQWEKFFASGKDTHSMSIRKTKEALQKMFDALVYIESKRGNNAVIANGDIAKWVLGFANVRKDSKVDGKTVISGTVLSKQQWATLQMDILHKAVEGKSFEIFFCDDTEEVVGDPKTEAVEEAETK